MASETVRRDLSRNMQQQIAAVYERNLNVARHVLGDVQLGELMFEAAVMMVRTTAASIAAFAPEDGREGLYDATIEGVIRQVHAGRRDALTRMAAELKGRS